MKFGLHQPLFCLVTIGVLNTGQALFRSLQLPAEMADRKLGVLLVLSVWSILEHNF
jgi:hypothetical protein